MCDDCPLCRHLVWLAVGSASIDCCRIGEDPYDHCSKFQAKTQQQIERDIEIFREHFTTT